MSKNTKSTDQSNSLATRYMAGMAIGLAAGIAIGIAMNSIPIGIAIGAGMGVSLGIAFQEQERKEDTVLSRSSRAWLIPIIAGLLLLIALTVFLFLLLV